MNSFEFDKKMPATKLNNFQSQRTTISLSRITILTMSTINLLTYTVIHYFRAITYKKFLIHYVVRAPL